MARRRFLTHFRRHMTGTSSRLLPRGSRVRFMSDIPHAFVKTDLKNGEFQETIGKATFCRLHLGIVTSAPPPDDLKKP
jgi:hypothetical protein